jgi:hypothetical protein
MHDEGDAMSFKSRLGKPLFWGAAGAAVAYLWDPDRGRGRRAQLQDQAAARARRVRERIDTKATYARTTAEGKIEGLRQSESAPPDDATLADKVRSEVLGSAEFQGHKVLVDACDGVVTLRGELPEPKLGKTLEKKVAGVTGVREVRNLLHEPDQPAPNKEEALNTSSEARAST